MYMGFIAPKPEGACAGDNIIIIITYSITIIIITSRISFI